MKILVLLRIILLFDATHAGLFDNDGLKAAVNEFLDKAISLEAAENPTRDAVIGLEESIADFRQKNGFDLFFHPFIKIKLKKVEEMVVTLRTDLFNDDPDTIFTYWAATVRKWPSDFTLENKRKLDVAIGDLEFYKSWKSKTNEKEKVKRLKEMKAKLIETRKSLFSGTSARDKILKLYRNFHSKAASKMPTVNRKLLEALDAELRNLHLLAASLHLTKDLQKTVDDEKESQQLWFEMNAALTQRAGIGDPDYMEKVESLRTVIDEMKSVIRHRTATKEVQIEHQINFEILEIYFKKKGQATELYEEDIQLLKEGRELLITESALVTELKANLTTRKSESTNPFADFDDDLIVGEKKKNLFRFMRRRRSEPKSATTEESLDKQKKKKNLFRFKKRRRSEPKSTTTDESLEKQSPSIDEEPKSKEKKKKLFRFMRRRRSEPELPTTEESLDKQSPSIEKEPKSKGLHKKLGVFFRRRRSNLSQK